MKPNPLLRLSRSIILCGLLSVLFQSCFLFPTGPDGNQLTMFAPKTLWVIPATGPNCDVSPVGNIVSAGYDISQSTNTITTTIEVFSPEGKTLNQFSTAGVLKEVVANYSITWQYSFSTNVPRLNTKNFAFSTYMSYGSIFTNPFTRYNTLTSGPDTDPYPWYGDRHVVGPSIVRGLPEHKFQYINVHGSGQPEERTGASLWVVGSFTDAFQPDQFTGVQTACPTFGKADCFVLLKKDGVFPFPVRQQWGGPENDLAYDVASDNIGNPTVFLRAGSDFGITSATQSIVRMKTGYNIVKLDTNGLLTSTFPVTLQAAGEISDVQIAIGKGSTVFIFAKDEVRQQYFLAKVTSSGTSWTRYFDSSTIAEGREMGFITDSKENIYVTGLFSGAISPNDAPITGGTSGAFVSSYSTNNVARGAMALGSGVGVNVRLSPQEDVLYVSGWAFVGEILGVNVHGNNLPSYKAQGFVAKLSLK
jgi:hypothetical protein